MPRRDGRSVPRELREENPRLYDFLRDQRESGEDGTPPGFGGEGGGVGGGDSGVGSGAPGEVSGDSVGSAGTEDAGWAAADHSHALNVEGEPGEVTAAASAQGAGPGASLSGHTHGIEDDAVTYPKLQNVSAASRALGRGSAAGAGDVEELSFGAGMAVTGTVISAIASGLLTTKGDLFTHDGTNPARLPVGANGAHLVADSSTTTGLRWGAIPLRPAQITANQNDFAPGSFGTWFINTDAARNFTGISATGADDGLEFLWINNGAFDEVLQHENAGSAAANRLICAGGGDLTVLPGEMVRIIRDGTAARFRCFLF